MTRSELDILTSVPEKATLSSGTEVVFEDLKARQFFKLLRILTHGAFPLLRDPSLMSFGPDEDVKEWGQRFLTLVLMAVPDAEDEAIEFVRAMVRPASVIDKADRPGGLSKVDRTHNQMRWDELNEELENPELDDLITIIEGVVQRELDDLAALGKRLGAMLKLAQKTGQIPTSTPSPTSTEPNSSGASPEPSTSSAPSTDGPMMSSGI